VVKNSGYSFGREVNPVEEKTGAAPNFYFYHDLKAKY
jgi:hypothetical protein